MKSSKLGPKSTAEINVNSWDTEKNTSCTVYSFFFRIAHGVKGGGRTIPSRNSDKPNGPVVVRSNLSVSKASRLLGCVILGVALQSVGQEATLSGVWIHSRDAKEQTQRYRSIDLVTEDIPQLFRGRANRMLREKTKPSAKINLTDTGERITFIRKDHRITVTTDNSPTRFKNEQGVATIRATRQDGKLVITRQAQDSKQETIYRLRENGALLHLDVSISGGRLNKPIRYQVTYHRESKN